MGGERSRVEVSSFPRAGKRIIFSGSGIWQVDEKHLEPMSLDQWLSDKSRDGDEEWVNQTNPRHPQSGACFARPQGRESVRA